MSADADSATVTLFDSILDGFQLAALCLGSAPHTATLGVSYSDVTDGVDIGDPECAATFGAGTLDVDPEFVNPSSLLPILRLKASSPLVDAGDPADPLGVDFAGEARKVDGDPLGGRQGDADPRPLQGRRRLLKRAKGRRPLSGNARGRRRRQPQHPLRPPLSRVSGHSGWGRNICVRTSLYKRPHINA